MKKKEMKEVAKKIAKLELIIQDPSSTIEVKKKAEKEAQLPIHHDQD